MKKIALITAMLISFNSFGMQCPKIGLRDQINNVDFIYTGTTIDRKIIEINAVKFYDTELVNIKVLKGEPTDFEVRTFVPKGSNDIEQKAQLKRNTKYIVFGYNGVTTFLNYCGGNVFEHNQPFEKYILEELK